MPKRLFYKQDHNQELMKMPDCFSKKKRSEVMSKIRSKGSKMEMIMLEALRQSNISFEYQPKVFGKPDFLIHPNVAVFCDSSFWHGRDMPKLHKQLSSEWLEHIERNKKRDKAVNQVLKKSGFIVLRFWDYQIKKDIASCITQIKMASAASN